MPHGWLYPVFTASVICESDHGSCLSLRLYSSKICVALMPVCLSVQHMWIWCLQGPKENMGSGMLQMVGSCHTLLGIDPVSSRRAASALNH